jgi:beta-glucuronidase
LKRVVFAIFAAGVLAAWSAPAQAQTVTAPSPGGLYASGHTDRYLLDGPWYFRLDRAGVGLRRGYARATQSLNGWTQINVPYAWNATDMSPASMRGTIGWYRKDFRVPRAAKGSSWIVRFESVNYRSLVYLNGHLIGRHEGGYIPFEFDLSRYLKRGKNTLVVRAPATRAPAGGTTAESCARSICAASAPSTCRTSSPARCCHAGRARPAFCCRRRCAT